MPESSDPATTSEERLLALVAAVTASHSKCCQEDVEAVLEMALHGAGLTAPTESWVTETAQGISSGSIVPITSRRGLDFDALMDDGPECS